MVKPKIGREVLLHGNLLAAIKLLLNEAQPNCRLPKIGLQHESSIYLIASLPGTKPTDSTFEIWQYPIGSGTIKRVNETSFERRDRAVADLQRYLIEDEGMHGTIQPNCIFLSNV